MEDPVRMGTTMTAVAIRVDLNRRGGWDVGLPDASEPVTCATLDEARRVAYESAADRHPCELIVYDAYHRVLHRELVDGERHRLTRLRG